MTTFVGVAVAFAHRGIPQALTMSAEPPDSARALAIDDVLRSRSLTALAPITIAPTGRWVAYTVRTAEGHHSAPGTTDRYFATNGRSTSVDNTELWVTNIATALSFNLTGRRGVSWGGVWSPDGQSLAFLSDRAGVPQLWLWNADTHQVRCVARVAIHTVYATEGPRWTSDGRLIVVKVVPESLDTASKGAVRSHAPSDSNHTIVRVFDRTTDRDGEGVNSALARLFVADLAVVNAQTGAVRRIVRALPIPSYAASPNGQTIAYTVLRGMESYQSQDGLLDLSIVNLADGISHVLAHNLVGNEFGHFTWSPTGRDLAYVATTYGRANRQDAMVIPLNGSSPIIVTPGPHPRFGDPARGPLWAPDGRSLYLVGSDTLWRAEANGSRLQAVGSYTGHQMRSIIAGAFSGVPWHTSGDNALYVAIRDIATCREGIGKIDLTTGRTHVLFEDDIASFFQWTDTFKIDAVGSQIVFPVQRANTPDDLWLADNDFLNRRRMTHLNPQFDSYAFGKTRRINWLSLDGETLHGAVLLPPNYVEGHQYPVVVWVYGGARSDADLNRFGLEPLEYNMQVLATRGYAVLIPDAPQHVGTPMLDLAKTVLPGVNKLIELGIADSARIGVGGYSYGGYSTLALLTTTPRFRAAVTVAGVGANLVSEYTLLNESGYSWGTGWAESGQGLMGASVWDRRDRFIENSPFFYLDRVATPLLLIHGDRDDPTLSRETYVALRRLGKDVAYAEYPQVRHAFTDASLAQQRDYYARILAWFDQYLRDTLPPFRDTGT
jgi:dipeptidyl aminopeptidase/acylaminoacyl peptidase